VLFRTSVVAWQEKLKECWDANLQAVRTDFDSTRRKEERKNHGNRGGVMSTPFTVTRAGGLNLGRVAHPARLMQRTGEEPENKNHFERRQCGGGVDWSSGSGITSRSGGYSPCPTSSNRRKGRNLRWARMSARKKNTRDDWSRDWALFP